MLVEQLLNENLEKSLYLHLKSSKYLDIYLKQDINSCLLELQQYLTTDINKYLKQNSITSLTSHPSLIAYKGLKDTQFFKNVAPLIEDYYLIGCTFKNWMLNNLDTSDYNKIIGRKHYKTHWLVPFPKALRKVLTDINSIYTSLGVYSTKEAFYPLLVKINEKNLVPLQFQKVVKNILSQVPNVKTTLEKHIAKKKKQRIKYLETRTVRKHTNVRRVSKSIDEVSIKKKLFSLEKSAIKRGLDFNLEYEDLLKLYKTKRCYYTGVRFDEKIKDKQLTLDRVDRLQGYVKGNVVACTDKANQMKMHLFECQSALTYQQTRSLINKIEKRLCNIK